MRRHDGSAAIVGASAAGLLTAARLARGGRSVTVFERSSGLDPSHRSLIVTHRLRELLGPLGERCVRNEIRRFEVYANGLVAEFPLEEPDLIIERSILIRDLAAEATRNGAEIVYGARFEGLTGTRGGVAVRTTRAGARSASETTSSVVVGADGATSSVARAAGMRGQPTVPLIQAIVDLPPDYPRDTTRVWFRPSDTPYFYWLIPDGSGRGALGVIGEEAAATRRRLDRFLDEHALTPAAYQAARIPAYAGWTPPRRRIGGGDVYLVGDAGGHVKVSTVGGIVTGLRGALAVAQSIEGGSNRALRALRRELDAHLVARRVLHRFSTEDYVRLLEMLNERAKGNLSVHTRDEPQRVLRSLVRAQPRILLLALQALAPRRGVAGRALRAASGRAADAKGTR
ncbi:MAG TPA: NAD(P)/FAD-dependent oxidoreductase [Actinomycetota bacterium]|nr:NAD(P)/FAD-dependent oxidoreductase [Actinomycetota bacterium]